MWIFGYGSLIWRPDFSYVDRRPGYIRGWTRRFYQGSTDHRGVPGAPGRVVTLLPDDAGHCWGVAYRIEGLEADRVLEALDHREKGGYARHRIPVYHQDALIVPDALVYIATDTNPDWLGPASPRDIARQVRHARGPSGHNAEYVLRLRDSLLELGIDDPHVSAVAEALELGIDNAQVAESAAEREPPGARARKASREG